MSARTHRVTEDEALEGNLFAPPSPERKPAGNIDSLRCLNDAIDSHVENADWIADYCGMSPSQFSKARKEAPGGGPLSELINRLPPKIRHDYAHRIGALDEDAIALLHVQQLMRACLDLLGHFGRRRPAKAELR